MVRRCFFSDVADLRGIPFISGLTFILSGKCVNIAVFNLSFGDLRIPQGWASTAGGREASEAIHIALLYRLGTLTGEPSIWSYSSILRFRPCCRPTSP